MSILFYFQFYLFTEIPLHVCYCTNMNFANALTVHWSLPDREGLLAALCHIDFHLGHFVLQWRRTLLLSHPISSSVLLHLSSVSVRLALWPGIRAPRSCSRTSTSQLSCESDPTWCWGMVVFQITAMKVIQLKTWQRESNPPPLQRYPILLTSVKISYFI